MNSKERGYIFQDIFSAYIISEKVNNILRGNKLETKIVLDKKSNTMDKFDDLKIIENNNSIEIQIKYSEAKEGLEFADLKNASSNYNLYQFIISNMFSKNENNYLIIRNKSGRIAEDLKNKLEMLAQNTFFKNSKLYKIKKDPKIIEEFYNSRLIKGKDKKQPYQRITKSDIEEFIDNFVIEVTDINLEDETLKKLIIDRFDSGVFYYSNITKDTFLKALLHTIRVYRAEDNYTEKSIEEITDKVIDILNLKSYLNPISNKMEIDEKIEISRGSDVNNVLELLKENNLIYIFGTPGVGKSWFSKQLKEEIEKESIISAYYFYFNKEDFERKKRINRFNFWSTINLQLQKIHGYNINVFNDNINNIIKEVNNTKDIHYIIFDGIDHISREVVEQKIVIQDLIKTLNEICTKTQNLKMILLAQPIDDIDVKCKYELKGFNKEETNELVDNFCSKYNVNEKIKQYDLFKKTNGNPLLINYIIKQYMGDGKVPEEKFKTVEEYYDYIFRGEEFYLYTYFGILNFPVNVYELSKISKVEQQLVQKEINNITNILIENEKNEYIVFHESLKKYIIKKQCGILDMLIDNVIEWLNSLNIYENDKAFNFLPELIVNNNKYDKFNKKYEIKELINCVIENGMSIAEVDKFNKLCYKIFSKRREFEQIYYIEHFSNIFKTYQYEVDLDIFEDYIRILFINGKIELIKKIMYKRGLIKYSNKDQQWEYVRKICKYLLANEVNLKYENIINMYFENSNMEDLITFDKILISKREIGLIIQYIKFYSYKKEKIIKEIEKQDKEISDKITDILNEDYRDFNLKLAGCGVFVKNKIVDLKQINAKYRDEKYISKFNFDVLLFFMQNDNKKEDIERLIESWDDIAENIPKFHKLIIEFINLLISDDTKETEYDKLFDKYHYSDLNFDGNIVYIEDEMNFLGREIVKNKNNNYIIKSFMNFYKRIKEEKTGRRHEGIIPFLGGVYGSIIYNVKINNVRLNTTTVNLLKCEIDNEESNSTNLRNIMTNYIMSTLSGESEENELIKIKNLMFSYGSYRDIQIWELIDIFDRLLKEKEMNREKFLKLYTIAYNAVDRMDRAKDVWHIPNELLEKYADNISSEDALKIFFYTLNITRGGMREDDSLFSYIYERLELKDYKQNKILFNYWRYISGNIVYGVKEKNTYLKKCLKNVNSSQFQYIKQEFLENIKNKELSLSIEDAKNIFKSKKNVIEYELKSEEKKNIKENINIKNIEDLILNINEKFISVRNITYESICNIINQLPNEDQIIKNILEINHFSSINYIYDTLEENKFDFEKYNSNKLITFLIGIYYRGNGNVANMEQDIIYEKCLQLDRIKTYEVLCKYFELDNDYQIGNKSGKIFKYLIEKEKIVNIFDKIMNFYNWRLPNEKIIKDSFPFNLGDKNDVLLNYFIIKIIDNKRNNRISTLDELIMVKLLDVKDKKHSFWFDPITIYYILDLAELYLKDLWLMKDSFLNWNNFNFSDIIEFQMNQNRTEILKKIHKCKKDISKKCIDNNRGLLAMDIRDVYNYKANIVQVYSEYGGLLDKDLEKRDIYIRKINPIICKKNKAIVNRRIKKIMELKKGILSFCNDRKI